MSDCCNCEVDTRALAAQQRRVLLIVLGINVATLVMMIAASILSGSSALLSGALDNFGDAVTYAVSFAAVTASARVKAQVAFLKGLLILGAAVAVAVQIAWRVSDPAVPIVETMGAAAVLNLVANLVCLRLLTPYREGDLNLVSAWECSRNDVFEGLAVILTAALVWLFGSAWPDLAVAVLLLALFLQSAIRVLRAAARGMRQPLADSAESR
jgi:Co/Zn/Cd efflux system component